MYNKRNRILMGIIKLLRTLSFYMLAMILVAQTPGNSHTAQQAAVELMYAALTGDRSHQ